MRLSNLCFSIPSRWFWCLLKFKNHTSDSSSPSKGISIFHFLVHPAWFFCPPVILGNSTFILSFHIHVLGLSPSLGLIMSHRHFSPHWNPAFTCFQINPYSLALTIQSFRVHVLSIFLRSSPPFLHPPIQSSSYAVPRIHCNLSCSVEEHCSSHLPFQRRALWQHPAPQTQCCFVGDPTRPSGLS